jgi:hypothetical protein
MLGMVGLSVLRARLARLSAKWRAKAATSFKLRLLNLLAFGFVATVLGAALYRCVRAAGRHSMRMYGGLAAGRGIARQPRRAAEACALPARGCSESAVWWCSDGHAAVAPTRRCALCASLIPLVRHRTATHAHARSQAQHARGELAQLPVHGLRGECRRVFLCVCAPLVWRAAVHGTLPGRALTALRASLLGVCWPQRGPPPRT